MKMLFTLLIFLNTSMLFGQHMIGKTEKEIRIEYPNEAIKKDFFNNTPVLYFENALWRMTFFMFREKCLMTIQAVREVSTVNKMVKLYDQLLIKEGKNRWKSYTKEGLTLIYELAYVPENKGYSVTIHEDDSRTH